jgi:hypothetical protein
MKQGEITGKNILAAAFGVLLVGIGVAFNNCAGFGNDPIGIVYDGIRNAGGMDQAQLGMASNVVNLSLLVLLFFIGRHYLSVGTFVYLLPYGFCVDAGNLLYRQLEDLQDVLMDLRKGLIDAQETFIQTDAEVSKSIGSAR